MLSVSPKPADVDVPRCTNGTQNKRVNPANSGDRALSDLSSINFLRSRRGLSKLAFLLMLYFLTMSMIFHSNSGGGGSIPPIYGEAHLTPEEFWDVRTAQPNESVLVTGGLGFIGSHVVDLLLHRGFKVTIMDDESNGHNHNKFTKEMVPHDITVLRDFPEVPTEQDEGSKDGYFTHVVHLAAAISVAESMTDPIKYDRINLEGSQKVINWIHAYNSKIVGVDPIRKLVAASSAAIYGDPDPSLLPLQESAPYSGKSPYADTKFRMEGLMQEFVTNQDMKYKHLTRAVALRFFNVYGPRQDPKSPYSGVISLFMEAALNGRDITILGDGEMSRDFVYVKDVARAIVLALLQDEDSSFAVYNVCSGKSITINMLAEQVRQVMESTSRIKHVDPRNGDIRKSSCNPNGARKGIGFESVVSIKGGLKKTSAWFRYNKS